MSNKRFCPDQDPDYENIVSNDQKRLKVIEKDNKEVTVRKIENIIKSQFNREKQLKEMELENIDQRLYQAQTMLDQLRACIVVSYYEQDGGIGLGTSNANLVAVHPAVTKLVERMAKSSFPSSSSLPKDESLSSVTSATAPTTTAESLEMKHTDPTIQTTEKQMSEDSSSSAAPLRHVESCEEGARGARFKTKKRVVVGNVSKYIPVDRREEKDQSTHKWMVYVRGPKEEPRIDHFVKKVWFFLHPSYRPNDLVEITHPPFHLTRRGWGEFPVRVQLHFHDPRNKRVDILHTLKLDTSYTGLQTLGAETIVDVLIYKPDVSICKTVAINDTVGNLVLEEPIEETVKRDVTTTPEMGDVASRIKQEPLDTYDSCETTFLGSNSCVNSELLLGHEDDTEHSISGDRNDTFRMNSSPEKSSIIENDCKVTLSANLLAPAKSTNAGNFQIVVVSNKSRGASSSNSPPVSKVASSLLPTVADSELNDANVTTSEGVSEKTPVCFNSPTEPAKSGAQPTANGVNTFVKCADKHGNLYLIPLSIFLKLDPASQASIIQSATAAQATSTNSIHLKSAHAQNVVCSTPTPAIVPFQAVRNPTASLVKSSTTPVFAPRIVKTVSTTRLPARPSTVQSVTAAAVSQLRPHNSVSLLSGVSRLKAPIGIAASSSSLVKTSDGLSLSRNNVGLLIGKEKNSRVSIPEISLSLDSFDTMEIIMKHILRYYPLVQCNPDRVSLPFCAPSVDVFLSWNVGKKCAAEWQRSRSIRNKLLQLCFKCDRWKESDVWSVKRTLLWCRRRGYSPMKPTTLVDKNLGDDSWCGSVATYTEADDLLARLSAVEDLPSRDHEVEEEVDVVTLDERLQKKTLSTSPAKLTPHSLFRLPSTPCGEFVRETIEQIGVKVNHEEVVEGVMAPLAEEVLLSATKSFMEDIMRTSLENAFERSGGQRCPSGVDVSDVARAVSRLPLCDFLTDRFMGTKMENYHLMDYENMKL